MIKAPERDLRTYTPKHLVDKILTQKSALEGERKQVTVLFADVKGSMNLAENVDAEEWHRILDRFFAILSEGVHRFEGTINQFTGDGVMALFGAPIAHEDHAQRACYAALHLTGELRRYAQELKRERGLTFSVRMGLNSGDVVVGKIGDDLRMDYTAQGQTVGLASRMEQIAEPGKTYLTEQTASLATGYFELEDLGAFKLKGVSSAVRAYALQGPGALRTRLDLSRWRGFSRFVGRESEMALLEEALKRSSKGEGQVVGIVGEVGVGKSRLCFEFLERARARGITVNSARGVSHGSSIPFLPVIEYLREAFEITEADDDLHARQKVAGALMLIDNEIAEVLPLIFEFLGVSDPEAPAPLMEGEGRQRRIFAVIRRFVEVRSGRNPTLILLEDLHWFDSASRVLLEGLIEAIRETQTLLVLNFRPEFSPSWTEAPHWQQLSLAPLVPEASDELLSDLIGDDASLEELKKRVQRRTQGNPFFIEELVRSLGEEGILIGPRGACRLIRPLEGLRIPATLQTLLAGRIDRLKENEKRLLQTAAVIGKEFSEPVLRKVVGLSEAEFAAALSDILPAEFIYEKALYPEILYAFKHPLTQEVAYQSQLSERRAQVHASVARALETAHRDTLDKQAALIAHHWQEAGNPLAAANWTHRAARWVGMSNPAEAMSLWRKLLRLLDTAPHAAEAPYLGARACRWLLFLGFVQGMPEDEAEVLLRAGKDYSRASHNPRSLAVTLVNYGTFRGMVAVDLARYVECTREALRIAEQSGQLDFQLEMKARLVMSLQTTAHFDEAVRLGREILERVSQADLGRLDLRDHVSLLWALGHCLNELGRIDEGIAYLERGLALATQHDLWANAGGCRNVFVRVAALTGDRALAETHALAAMSSGEKTGNLNQLVLAHDALGVAHQMHGRWPEAVACGEEALSLTDQSQTTRVTNHIHRANLAAAYLGAGDPTRARELAEAAVALSARCGPRYTPRTQLALARVLLASEGKRARTAIEAHLEAAQQVVEATHARIYEPHILEVRAQLAERSGDEESRIRLLRDAQRHYAELGIGIHATRLAGELG